MTTTPLRSEPRLWQATAASAARASGFRSPRGALGALVLLLALPVTIAVQIIVPDSSEVVIHAALGLGTLLIGWSAFKFATPRWLTWSAAVAAVALAAIFLAQSLSALTQGEALRNVAYSREIGGWGEALTSAIVMAWFVAVALSHGRGVTMLLGVLSSALVVGLSVWSMLAAPLGGTPAELRLLFLLPIAWFLFVSTRRAADR